MIPNKTCQKLTLKPHTSKSYAVSKIAPKCVALRVFPRFVMLIRSTRKLDLFLCPIIDVDASVVIHMVGDVQIEQIAIELKK